jgi:hypothetical protein
MFHPQEQKNRKATQVAELAQVFIQYFRETMSSADSVFYFHVFFREIPRIIRALPCDILYASAESAEHLNGVIKRTILRRTNLNGGRKFEGKENKGIFLQSGRIMVLKQFSPEQDNPRMVKMKLENRFGGVLKPSTKSQNSNLSTRD